MSLKDFLKTVWHSKIIIRIDLPWEVEMALIAGVIVFLFLYILSL